jgi:hypothetical protein
MTRGVTRRVTKQLKVQLEEADGTRGRKEKNESMEKIER